MSTLDAIENGIVNSTQPTSNDISGSELLPVSASGLVFTWERETGETALWRIVEATIDTTSQNRLVTVIKMNTKKYILEDIPLKTLTELMQTGKIIRQDDPWPKNFMGRKPSDAAVKLRQKRLQRISKLIALKY